MLDFVSSWCFRWCRSVSPVDVSEQDLAPAPIGQMFKNPVASLGMRSLLWVFGASSKRFVHVVVFERKKKKHTLPSICSSEQQKHDGNRELSFLGHRNAVPWNFTSGTVPRVKHPECGRAEGPGGPARPPLPSSSLIPASILVHILDIFSQNTSHIHTPQQVSAPVLQASAVHSVVHASPASLYRLVNGRSTSQTLKSDAFSSICAN